MVKGSKAGSRDDFVSADRGAGSHWAPFEAAKCGRTVLQRVARQPHIFQLSSSYSPAASACVVPFWVRIVPLIEEENARAGSHMAS
jgi:hypothetical protein